MYGILPAVNVRQETTRYDAGAIRQSHRKSARETGEWVYVPAAVLRELDRDPRVRPSGHRMFAMSRNSLAIRFYD